MDEISFSLFITLHLDGPPLSFDLDDYNDLLIVDNEEGDWVLYEAYRAVIKKIIDYSVSIGASSIMVDDVTRGDAVIQCPGVISLTVSCRAVFIDDNESWATLVSFFNFMDEFHMQMGGIFTSIEVNFMD